MQLVNRNTHGALAGIVVAVLASVLLLLAFGVGRASASFGLADLDGQWTADAAGDAYTQAAGHPFAVSTEIKLNQHYDPVFEGFGPDAPPKDILTSLPAGLIGNPGATSVCPNEQFVLPQSLQTHCSNGSQIGIAAIDDSGFYIVLPVYNVQAPPTVPARLGLNLLGVPILLDASLRSNGDYGLDINARDISEALPLIGINLTVWGTPADRVHDGERCSGFHVVPNGVIPNDVCGGEPGTAFGPNASGLPPVAFMTLPARCTPAGVGLGTRVQMDSWNEPGVFQEATFFTHEPPSFPAEPAERGPQVGVTGCEGVPFEPSIQVTPSVSAPASPSGLNVSLSIPTAGLENETGIAQSEVKKVLIRFPEGMAVNPSAADGLGACSEAQIGLDSTTDASCPDASKIGTVTIDTPLLKAPLAGSLFLARQNENPFGSLLAVYLVAKGPGLIIKLPGRLDADPNTGQLTTTFDNTPQVPFSELLLSLKSGPRAPLVTPSSCGEKTIVSELTGWSGKTVTISNGYTVDCSAGLGGFAPGFSAGTSNNQSGGFSPFSLTLTRGDGQQPFGAVSVQLPPGLLGVLKSVPLCGEPQAAQGTCGQESLIGHTTVGAGAGSNPFYLGGQVFLTGPYKGAPFGLSIVVPAVAGPLNLGTVVVRASIAVDPHTAQLTVTSDALPTILQGIPLDLRVVNVTVDRGGFTFNPTNCEPLSVTGTIMSSQGASVVSSEHFQAADCAALAFAPKLLVSSLARTSRAGGAALDVKVAYPSGAQANIRSVAVTLPKQLPARLSTIQQACPAATFEANPASCGEGAMIGVGTASTPVFSRPLTGPAYLVSHGGESFPDIVVVLQGEGVTISLVGNVFITKSGITRATFARVPDAPISAFDLSLPEGPHSALSAVGSLCAGALAMPTTITGQNGAVVRQATKIKVTGCAKAKHKTKKHRKHRKHKGNAKKGSAGKGR